MRNLYAGLTYGGALAGSVCSAQEDAAEAWTIHAQSTVIEQWHGGFHSFYSGENSLNPQREDKHTATLTIFLGRRLWRGGQIYYNPEVAQGNGLSDVVGVAGFPNGEATRAGSRNSEYNTARLFVRQTFDLGGGSEPIEADRNQLAGATSIDCLTLTLGKFSATDIFDNNSYSHDSRTQFLNWALMDNGAWDYPADVKGYTGGFSAEWKQRPRALRWGVFMMPVEANGRALDKHLGKAWGQIVEWEERYTAHGRVGVLRTFLFWNRAHMGSYAQALLGAGVSPPDIKPTCSYRSKAGGGLNWEQEIAEGVGVFARASCNDGHAESWAFTEIDRTVSAGLSVKGSQWERSEDTLGIAVVADGLSAQHRRYLAAGGYGFIVGDGTLRYGPEQIFETYYDWKPYKWISFAADAQLIGHPAYNRDRGPVTAFAVRTHIEF